MKEKNPTKQVPNVNSGYMLEGERMSNLNFSLCVVPFFPHGRNTLFSIINEPCTCEILAVVESTVLSRIVLPLASRRNNTWFLPCQV